MNSQPSVTQKLVAGAATTTPLRIAIVGCGKIADQHVAAIRRIQNCEVVSLCDQELLMAKQLGARFGIAECFSDVAEMLRATNPDVVHVTTTPQSHFSIARQCLEFGCHVYVEKPFTVTCAEAESLIEFANRRKLKVTAGHNLQFTLEMLEMRQLLHKGFLGGPPVHLDSYFSYSVEDPNYFAPVLGNRGHWVRRLPGQLLHNLISHGIARLAEFLDDDLADVVAVAYQSPRLRNLGGEEILDELRVLIRDQKSMTAFFSFSTQFKPALNELRICGPANSIVVDHISGTLIRNPNQSYKSYLTYFLPPLKAARQHFRNFCRNIGRFLNKELYQDFGMKELIERFYNSIRRAEPLPIPYREIVLTARIMDEIFRQVYGDKRSEISGQRSEAQGPNSTDIHSAPVTRHLSLS